MSRRRHRGRIPERPVFSANGPDDYVCAECGNVLAVAMPPQVHEPQAPHSLRTVPDQMNDEIEVPGVDYRSAFERRAEKWRSPS